MEIKEIKDKFEPVILQITFNSKEEIIAFWHRMNAATKEIEEIVDREGDYNFSEEGDYIAYPLWEWADDKLVELN